MTSKIYVGNLGYNVTNEALAEKFAEFGEVQSAKIIMDRDTNRSKGFGFVEMAMANQAEAAIESLNGTDFDNRKMTVTEARPMVPKTNSRFY